MKTPFFPLIGAILFCTASISKPVIGQDCFSEELARIEITFDDNSWHDTLAMRKKRDDKTPVIAKVSVNGRDYPAVEVRYKGNSSFHGTLKHGGNKLPFKLEMPKGQTFDGGYEELRLSNNFRDPSAIRELLAYEIASTYVPVPKVQPAELNINGEFIGVYTMTEGISDRMIREYYCHDEGVLVKCDPQFNLRQPQGCPKGEYSNLKYLGKNPECYKPLYDVSTGRETKMIMDLTEYLAGPADPDSYINVHEALWMHALNNVLVNLDSYLGIFCHNYFVYRDTHDIYHPLIWDLNLAFGGFSTIDNGNNPDLYELSPIAHQKYLEGRRPLIETLTRDRINLLTYFTMINTIVDDWFASGRYKETAGYMQELIRPYQAQEVDPMYTIEHFDMSMTETVKRGEDRSILGIAQLMDRRVEYLKQHPLLTRNTPGVDDWSVDEVSDAAGGNKFRVNLRTNTPVTEAFLYYQSEDCGRWSKQKMTQLSSVGLEIIVDELHKFYFLITTDKGAALYPSSAPNITVDW